MNVPLLIRIVAGLVALIPGFIAISLTMFSNVGPVLSAVVWVGFLVKLAIVIVFIKTERVPTDAYIEISRASEIFDDMNSGLMKLTHENKRLRSTLKSVLGNLKAGDIVGSQLVRWVQDQVEKTENGKG